VKPNRRILLYGNSVILGSIGVSLRRCPQFEVAIQAPQPNETKELLKKNPDVLLFDLEAPHTEAVFSLLKTDPALLVIGVSPGINLVDIWSGRRLRELTLQGLLELIGKTENGSPVA
jgi:hypothetical protein